jgi:hypothetical protein
MTTTRFVGSRLSNDQPLLGGALSPSGQPCRFAGLEPAQPFHADSVRLAAEHPPIDIPYAELGIRDVIPSP